MEVKECSSTAESSDEEDAKGSVIGSVGGLGPFCGIFSRKTSDGEESNRGSQQAQVSRGKRSPRRLRQEKAKVEARGVLRDQGKGRPRQEKPSKVEEREVIQDQGKGSPPRLMQEETSRIEAISDEEELMFSANDDWDGSNSEAESSESSYGEEAAICSCSMVVCSCSRFGERKPYNWDRSNSEAGSSESSSSGGEEAVVYLGRSSESCESNSEVEDEEGDTEDLVRNMIGSVNGAGQFCGIFAGSYSDGEEETFWRPWESSGNCDQHESVEEMEDPGFHFQYMAVERGEELSGHSRARNPRDSNDMGATEQTKMLALRKNTRVWPVLYPTPAPTFLHHQQRLLFDAHDGYDHHCIQYKRSDNFPPGSFVNC